MPFVSLCLLNGTVMNEECFWLSFGVFGRDVTSGFSRTN